LDLGEGEDHWRASARHHARACVRSREKRVSAGRMRRCEWTKSI